MEKTIKYLISAFAGFVLALFLLRSCDNPGAVIEKTVVKHKTDTTYIVKNHFISDTVSVIKYIDTSRVYDTAKYRDDYFSQVFTDDSLYTLNTFGGYVDSINLNLKIPETTIRDSIFITNKQTIYKNYKNNISLGYMFNGGNIFRGGYTRNIGRFGIGADVGFDNFNKNLMVGGHISYSFGK